MPDSTYRFSPADFEEELTAIIRDLLSLESFDQSGYEAVLRRHPKPEGGFFSKSHLIQGFHHFKLRHGWALQERSFLERLRMKPVRTQSGVAPVTVLTKPYPCPGKCIFCPSDVRMPKSYISSEPGAQRAAQHQFDPYWQSLSRLRTYHNIGHATDKIELIVLGGTWSSYPEAYQIWFVTRCLEALNHHGNEALDAAPPETASSVDYRAIAAKVDGRLADRSYNRSVNRFLERLPSRGRASESMTWQALHEQQRANESAAARCVGMVLETRPDHLDLDEVLRLRRLGATKIQIGYQSLSDEVLRLNHRGHDVAATRRAMKLLRQAGFKIHAHWMPNLYGSSPEHDVEDFRQIFADPDFRPDELKIYPCSLVETAELMAYYESGDWRPYSQSELLEVVGACMQLVPEYCRVTRVVRDIPGTEIVDGSRVTNLRELVEAQMQRRGMGSRDIRAREIRHRAIDPRELELRRLDYQTSGSREIFLQYVTPADRIAGFLRLSLPHPKAVEIDEIARSAMIREVHVYGLLAGIGQRQGTRSQHLGLGRALIEEAAALAIGYGFDDLAVISALGTRPYYRQNGFTDGDLYQHRPLTRRSSGGGAADKSP